MLLSDLPQWPDRESFIETAKAVQSLNVSAAACHRGDPEGYAQWMLTMAVRELPRAGSYFATHGWSVASWSMRDEPGVVRFKASVEAHLVLNPRR